MESTTVLEKNPIIFRDDKQKRLDEAKKIFFETLVEYAKAKNLSEDEYKAIVKYLEEAYLEKKASYILQERMKEFSSYLSNALKFALEGAYEGKAVKENFTRVFYLRNKRSTLNYERFR